MPDIHSPNVIGAISLAGDPGVAGQLLTSAGPGAQAIWVGTVGLYQDFGAVGNLGENLNDEVLFTNTGGFHSIGFSLVVPTGGRVAFEGSYDGTNFVPVTVLATDGTGYVRGIDYDDTFIGSIATMRLFRVITVVAGSAPGTVIGRVSDAQNVIEGLDQTAAPHNIGMSPQHLGFEFTTPQTDVVVGVVLTADYKYAFTEIYISVTGTGNVTFFDETNNQFTWAFTSDFAVPLDQRENISRTFALPFVASAGGNSFKVTTTGTIQIIGTVHGYIFPAV